MAREYRSLRSDLERCRDGCLREEPLELAFEIRVKAGDAGGIIPARTSMGLGGGYAGGGGRAWDGVVG